jgi:riboflavin kinase/FMN adenylyltransferase
VHLGHRALITRLGAFAAERGLRTAVVTFDQHPAQVVRPESAPLQLTDLDQEIELLSSTGVDYVLVLTFDEQRAKETAEEFVQEVLVGCLNAKLVVVGADFHFGHERQGDVAFLERAGAEAGFDVLGMGLVGADGTDATDAAAKVSSTAIRKALEAGDLTRANAMLGRPHELRGRVEHGDNRGGPLLGFPTANVAVPAEAQLPADGIYACWYRRPEGEPLPAVASLGRRPTFYVDQPYRLLEVHLLDFSGDLYGETAAVQFVARLRGEVRFDGIDALIAQMRADCDDASRILASTERAGDHA